MAEGVFRVKRDGLLDLFAESFRNGQLVMVGQGAGLGILALRLAA